jgi:hypothetical protein
METGLVLVKTCERLGLSQSWRLYPVMLTFMLLTTTGLPFIVSNIAEAQDRSDSPQCRQILVQDPAQRDLYRGGLVVNSDGDWLEGAARCLETLRQEQAAELDRLGPSGESPAVGGAISASVVRCWTPTFLNCTTTVFPGCARCQ